MSLQWQINHPKEIKKEINGCFEMPKNAEVALGHVCLSEEKHQKLCQQSIVSEYALNLPRMAYFFRFTFFISISLAVIMLLLILGKGNLLIPVLLSLFISIYALFSLWYIWLIYVFKLVHFFFNVLLSIIFIIMIKEFFNIYPHLKKASIMVILLGKWILNQPLFIFLPFFNMILVALFLFLFILINLIRLSNVELSFSDFGTVICEPGLFIKISSFFFLSFFFWSLMFLKDCSLYMVSHVIVNKYFTNKELSCLRLLISAFLSMVAFHLGSIVLGTILMNIILGLATLLFENSYKRKQKLKLQSSVLDTNTSFSFRFFDHFLRFYQKSSYVGIALFGKNLEVSSKLTWIISTFHLASSMDQPFSICIKTFDLLTKSLTVLSFIICRIVFQFDDDSCNVYPLTFMAPFLIYLLLDSLFSQFKQMYIALFLCMSADEALNSSNINSLEIYYQDIVKILLKQSHQ